MKKIYSLITILMVWFFTACSGQTSNNALSPKQFSDKIKTSKNILIPHNNKTINCFSLTFT
jgi:hypothetical protein